MQNIKLDLQLSALDASLPPPKGSDFTSSAQLPDHRGFFSSVIDRISNCTPVRVALLLAASVAPAAALSSSAYADEQPPAAASSPNDPFYSLQWYLSAVGAPSAWSRGWTGAGSRIDVVDGSVQYSHEDLAANYDPSHSYDFYQGDSDPATNLSDTLDYHGTTVTGEACGVGNNGLGITGVAFGSTFAAQRGIGPDGTFSIADASAINKLASAITYGADDGVIKNLSWGEYDSFGSLIDPCIFSEPL